MSIGKIVSAAQGVTYYERDGYYASDDPAHRDASAWAGKGSEALGLSGPVNPDTFTAILEGKVSGLPQLGQKDWDGSIPSTQGTRRLRFPTTSPGLWLLFAIVVLPPFLSVRVDQFNGRIMPTARSVAATEMAARRRRD